MARQLPPQDLNTTSPRQQSAPINIEYGNTNEYQYQPRYWREEPQRQREEDYQNTSDWEDDEYDMPNGFSGGVIDPPIDQEKSACHRSKENHVTEEQQRCDDKAIKRQKIDEMNDDLFEQLLAENERKLRQLISYVKNVHLVLN